MTEQEQRQAVVAEALTWLRTPYHHEGKLKGIGVDCAMLPLIVYQNCGLVPADLVIPKYSPQWHLHQREEKYLDIVLLYTAEIFTDPQPGDLILYKYGHTFSHGALTIAWPKVIHAAANSVVCYADGINMSVAGHVPTDTRFFSYWEAN